MFSSIQVCFSKLLRSSTFGVLLGAISLVPITLRATNYYVNDGSPTGDRWCGATGSDANPGTAAQPYATLKFAITSRVLTTGDTVFVDVGTYSDNAIVVGSGDAGVVIYGAGRDVVTYDKTNFSAQWMEINGNNVKVEGIRVTRYGYSTGLKGQALTIENCSGVTIKNCTFDNEGTSGGEAPIYITTTSTLSTSATIDNCLIQNNSGNYGGGIDVCSNTLSGVPTLNVTISNCLIESNAKLNYNGAALLIYSGLSAGGSTLPPTVTVTNTVMGSSGMPNRAQRGGAIYVDDGATLNMTGGCVGYNVANDVAGPDGGGGLYIFDGTVNATDCLFYNNTANTGTPKYGGAVFVNKTFSGTSTLNATRCQFNNNTGLDGGAIFGDNSTLNLTNCLLYSNTANDEGGAICLNDANATLVMYNTTVANNISSGGASAHGGLESKNCLSATVKNSIFWGNTRGEMVDEGSGAINVSWSDVDPTGASVFTSVTGNIAVDPLFVNSASSDFRLQAGSPCINTGNLDGGAAPTNDLVGTSRTGNPDMGSYELGATATSTRDCPSLRQQILPLESFALAAHCNPNGGASVSWTVETDGIIVTPEGSSDAKVYAPLPGDPQGIGFHQILTPEEFAAFRYFRLKVVDREGLVRYSETVVSDCFLPAQSWSVFPNPFQRSLSIEGFLDESAMVSLSILDLSGKIWNTEVRTLENGYSRTELSLETLPAGMYLVRIENIASGHTSILKAVKQ